MAKKKGFLSKFMEFCVFAQGFGVLLFSFFGFLNLLFPGFHCLVFASLCAVFRRVVQLRGTCCMLLLSVAISANLLHLVTACCCVLPSYKICKKQASFLYRSGMGTYLMVSPLPDEEKACARHASFLYESRMGT